MSVTLTERAAQKARKLLSRAARPDSAALRVSYDPGACASLAHRLAVVDEPQADDEVSVVRGVRLAVDRASLPYVDGLEIDWSGVWLRRGWVFNNPRARGGSCGPSCTCG